MGKATAAGFLLALTLGACTGSDTITEKTGDTGELPDTGEPTVNDDSPTDSGTPVDVDDLLSDDDGDGLTKGEEERLGTDPDNPDTDGGGAPDGLEVLLVTDPLDASDDATILDGDGDGLTDAQEAAAGTDPALPDTDADGLADGVEVLLGTDPLDDDTDGGGALDGAEVFAGADPLDPSDDAAVIDTDADGLTDAVERALGTDPKVADTDGDGLIDGEEVNLHQSDPRLVDTDGDTLGDGEEVDVLGTSPIDRDSDGGGVGDRFEVLWRTDPTDAGDEGAYVLADDFEAGGLDAALWQSQNDEVSYTDVPDQVFQGEYALRLSSEAEAITEAFDTSGCSELLWVLQHKRGPENPDPGDDLTVEYWDGAQWIIAGALPGGFTDPTFRRRFGVLAEKGALNKAFQLRYTVLGSQGDFDHHHVDDLVVLCDPDSADDDLDGVVNILDCAPSDPLHWADCGLCVDGDGDGYGVDCDLGSDCDDADKTISPEGTEVADDGVDQDCDGFDTLTVLSDDFDAGSEDSAVWAALTGDVAVVDVFSQSGAYSLNLDLGGSAVTDTLDTTSCDTIVWKAQIKRGLFPPEPGDDLVVTWDDGTGTGFPVATVPGVGAIDEDFALVFAEIEDKTAKTASFSVALTVDAVQNGGGDRGDDFYIDDFGVGCSEVDLDGDGFPGVVDCDNGDDRHWFDCGVCVDTDDDGYGAGCDLGADCDDSNAKINPVALDPFGDGVDDNCDGADGGFFEDDFESGSLDTAKWPVQTGDVSVNGTVGGTSGALSLNLGSNAFVETATVDTRTCPEVIWHFSAKRGPGIPEDGDDLVVSWSDGVTVTETGVVPGLGRNDAGFSLYFGTLADKTAQTLDFSVTLEHTSPGGNDDYFVDDFVIECTDPDSDGDGFPPAIDCDELSASHWLDCDDCVDDDGDDYGLDCDLGDDCDDGDKSVLPGASDTRGDGIDQDCSGIDGPGVVEDFDAVAGGGPGPGVARLTGDFAFSQEFSVSGDNSLFLGGGIGIAELVPIDLASCPSLAWEMQALRGADEPPDAGDTLAIQAWTGAEWSDVFVLDGTSLPETTFTRYTGTSVDKALLVDGLEVRVISDGTGQTLDDYLVDDLAIGCDDDEDGLSSPAELALYLTDPDLADTDGDSIDDGTEIANGTDPLDKSDPGPAAP